MVIGHHFIGVVFGNSFSVLCRMFLCVYIRMYICMFVHMGLHACEYYMQVITYIYILCVGKFLRAMA